MIMAGGTGGHIFPALAVARLLQADGVPVVWLGTRRGLESRIVPQAGLPIEWLSISGLRGKGKLTLALAPFKLALACWQSLRALLRHRPRCVLGMGGFVAGPGGWMAKWVGVPLVIHEQNAVAGLTNVKLAPRASAVLEAFPHTFAQRYQAECVGNPVRQEILAIPELRLAADRPLKLLVIGGSLGAMSLNQMIPKAIAALPENARPQVRHQTGQHSHKQTIADYRELAVEAQVDAFIEDMAAAYHWADVVICRAGAMTVSELAVAGRPALFVPYPFAVDDHQRFNAAYLANAGAAVCITQKDLTVEGLTQQLSDWHADRDALLSMSQKAREKALPHAAQRVAEVVLTAGGTNE
ncbi:undecaprenyldiphospho-muramoylpentapeptide beta-N-acetylglucosaminyltransferase [gamma proteobacterium HTCC5015]|nr:undecaprenyldiphospho-muramoylpentapeptide beta-N-acetylglucosaminyltransferase [gamma proteobacterium HTCC5015]